jgi:hypothetical protein
LKITTKLYPRINNFVPFGVYSNYFIDFKGKVKFEENNKNIYNQFKVGDSVKINYKEYYDIKGKVINRTIESIIPENPTKYLKSK